MITLLLLCLPCNRPRPPVWEISEPEQDEGIQADLQSVRNRDRLSYTNIRASTASTLSGLSTGQQDTLCSSCPTKRERHCKLVYYSLHLPTSSSPFPQEAAVATYELAPVYKTCGTVHRSQEQRRATQHAVCEARQVGRLVTLVSGWAGERERELEEKQCTK